MRNRTNLEGLILKEIQNIKHDTEKVERLKNGLLRGGISRGETQKLIIGENKIDILTDDELCLLSIQLFGISGNQMIHPQLFFNHTTIDKMRKEVIPVFNIINSKKLYNEKIKNDFLNSGLISSQTIKNYRRIFSRSSIMEKVLQKDLYDFTLEELEEFLYDLNPTTLDASNVNARIITTYLNWAIVEGYKKEENPLTLVSSKYFSKFVDETIKIYFTDYEINFIEDNCDNSQDAVIFALLFTGVGGKDMSELRNLKKQDVNFETGELLLTDSDGSTRIIIVNDYVLHLIRQALDQREYYKKNGQAEQADNIREFTTLIQSNYVLRNSNTNTDNVGAVNSNTIYRRIKIISETVGIPYLNGKNVSRSGMIAMAKELLEEEKELGNKQYKKIAERFRVSSMYHLKTFCNIKTINELYKNSLKKTRLS